MKAKEVIDEAFATAGFSDKGIQFEDIMDSFLSLQDETQFVIRNAARQRLRQRNRGEEIGSSDVNHEIVSIFHEYGDWQEALIALANGG